MSKFHIRIGTFETNSSAMHTLQISNKGLSKCRLKVHDDGYVHISLDQEFGTEDNVFFTQKDKLKYIVTWLYSYYDFNLEEVEEGYLWRDFNEEFANYVNKDRTSNFCFGVKVDSRKYDDACPYWDHQIYDGKWNDEGCVVSLWNAKECVEFIFNKYISLVTGCD